MSQRCWIATFARFSGTQTIVLEATDIEKAELLKMFSMKLLCFRVAKHKHVANDSIPKVLCYPLVLLLIYIPNCL
jgi:hypothetical protein